VLRPLAALTLAAIAAGCAGGAPPDYVSSLATERAAKDEAFRTDPDSPIPADKRTRLLPLAYYPIDESWSAPARLDVAGERVKMDVPTSTGKIRSVQRIGTLKFTLKSRLLALTAFLEEDGRLFIPFADPTNGTDTYAAGRYMNLTPTATGIYVIDFNVAYNPYCYYNAEFDCPFPPPENRLALPIQAGERVHAPSAAP
jgi:uncharacterized protein (DUF1684 family)